VELCSAEDELERKRQDFREVGSEVIGSRRRGMSDDNPSAPIVATPGIAPKYLGFELGWHPDGRDRGLTLPPSR
jgi:hypothetical protein